MRLLLRVAAALVAAPAASADTVAGSAKVPFTDFPVPGQTTTEQFTVGAQSGPLGENPQGAVVTTSPLLETGPAHGTVTCVRVFGNIAQVGGVLDKPVVYNGDTGFRWFEWIIADNGPPDGVVPDSFISLFFFERTHPPDFDPCSVFVAPLFPVESGNFVVNDD
jgi:hypothetical protein